MLVLLAALCGVFTSCILVGIVIWWMTEDVSTEEVLYSRFSKVALVLATTFIILMSLVTITGGADSDRYQLSLYVIGDRGEQTMIHSSTYRTYGSCRRSRNGMVDNASNEHRAGVVAICTSIRRDNLETPETF